MVCTASAWYYLGFYFSLLSNTMQAWFQNSEGFGIDEQEVILEANLVSPSYPDMVTLCKELSKQKVM